MNVKAAALQSTAAVQTLGVPGALSADNGAHDVPHGVYTIHIYMLEYILLPVWVIVFCSSLYKSKSLLYKP
jgi:hypothetical protein